MRHCYSRKETSWHEARDIVLAPHVALAQIAHWRYSPTGIIKNITLDFPNEIIIVKFSVCLLIANETMNEHLCSFYDDEDCLYVFVYSFNDTKPYIRAQKERECPKKVIHPSFNSLLLALFYVVHLGCDSFVWKLNKLIFLIGITLI